MRLTGVYFWSASYAIDPSEILATLHGSMEIRDCEHSDLCREVESFVLKKLMGTGVDQSLYEQGLTLDAGAVHIIALNRL